MPASGSATAFNGCCHGQPTALSWAVDFGDGVGRHPTQIYESLFHLGMATVILLVMRAGTLRNHRLKLYLIAYCAFRFVTEWLRPEPAGWLGLTFYQAVTAVFAMALAVQWMCDAAPNSSRARGFTPDPVES